MKSIFQAASAALCHNGVMPTKRKLVAALLLIVALIGVARAEDKQPTVKLKGIALKRLDLKGLIADAGVSLEIENPGPASASKCCGRNPDAPRSASATRSR